MITSTVKLKETNFRTFKTNDYFNLSIKLIYIFRQDKLNLDICVIEDIIFSRLGLEIKKYNFKDFFPFNKLANLFHTNTYNYLKNNFKKNGFDPVVVDIKFKIN